MKTCCPFLRLGFLSLAGALFGSALAAGAAETPAGKESKPVAPAAAAAKAPAPEIEIPKSVFNIPTNPQDGKDPFYPLSTRLFPRAVIVASSQTAAVPVVELQLKSLSGVPGHRFAIINNHTFEVGEEAELMTNLGRARVRCLDIKDDSVLVLVGAEQRVLKLRAGL
jgi:hypothetical protein